MPVTRRCIIKATPTSDFAVSDGEHMYPFGLKLLLRIESQDF